MDNSACPGCGRSFTCGVKAGENKCWCMERPVGLPVPAGAADCYCPDCLERMRQARLAAQQ